MSKYTFCVIFFYVDCHYTTKICTGCFTTRPTNLQENQGAQRGLEIKQQCRVENAIAVTYDTEQEEKKEQEHVNGTKSILLKDCTAESVRNYDQKSSGRIESGATWNSLRSRTFLAYHISFRQLQIFEVPERKEFHPAPLSSLPGDFWS